MKEFTLQNNDETGASIVWCFFWFLVLSVIFITVIAMILLLIKRIL